MKRFLAAIRFLTIIPVPGTWGAEEDSLARSVIFFPLVGLLLGVICGAIAFGLSFVVGGVVGPAVVVIVLLVFSGGLHMDGLSDTADGFFSARPRERILEIMKDSHIGAMGVMAIVCVLLLKFAALAEVAGRPVATNLASGPWATLTDPARWFSDHSIRFWKAALLMPLAGRAAIVIQMVLLPYAKPEGLGKVFCRNRPIMSAGLAVLLLAGIGFLLVGLAGVVMAGALVAVASLFAGYCHRKIGGATGDTFGAACEIGELATAVMLAVWLAVAA